MRRARDQHDPAVEPDIHDLILARSALRTPRFQNRAEASIAGQARKEAGQAVAAPEVFAARLVAAPPAIRPARALVSFALHWCQHGPNPSTVLEMSDRPDTIIVKMLRWIDAGISRLMERVGQTEQQTAVTQLSMKQIFTTLERIEARLDQIERRLPPGPPN